MTEIWKTIDINSKYEISSYGRVRRETRFLKFDLSDKRGYRRVSLSHNAKMKHYLVHRLVASTFLLNPFDLPQVNHKDGDKSNNRVDNLEWVTGLQNMHHAYQNNLLSILKGEQLSKFRAIDIQLLRAWRETGLSFKELKTIYSLSNAQISRICHKTRWAHLEDLSDVC